MPELEELGRYLEGEEVEIDERSLEEIRKKEYYRSSRVRMYYVVPKAEKGETPVPFCEVRVWVLTREPRDLQDKLKEELDFLEDYFLWSIGDWARPQGNAVSDEPTTTLEDYTGRLRPLPGQARSDVEDTLVQPTLRRMNLEYKIEGREDSVKIDGEEAIVSWFRTGLPTSEWNLGRIYRYIAFFDKNGNIKREYVESKANFIRMGISSRRLSKMVEIDIEGTWLDWHLPSLEKPENREEIAKRRLKEDKDMSWKGIYMTDLEWRKGEPWIVVTDTTTGNVIHEWRSEKWEMKEEKS